MEVKLNFVPDRRCMDRDPIPGDDLIYKVSHSAMTGNGFEFWENLQIARQAPPNRKPA